MNEMNSKCYFHAHKLGNYTCESCNKLICDDCSELEKKEEGSRKVKKIVRHYFCKPCYYDKELSKIKSSPKHILRKIVKFIISPILIITAPIFAFLFTKHLINSSPFQFYFLFFLMCLLFLGFMELVIIMILLKGILNTPKTIKKLNKEKARFFTNVNSFSMIYQANKENDLTLKCPYCNTQIEPEIKICSSCGMSINNKN